MKKRRVAVVGCGALATGQHLPNCVKNPRIELVATCDIDPAAAEKARETFGAQRAEMDMMKVVEADDVDLCILATHQTVRGAFMVPALRAGKPVYTEKPLAPSRQEMVDILLASRDSGVPVCVGHNRRSSPAMLEFKRLVEKARSGLSPVRPSVDRAGARGALPEQDTLQVLMRVNDDVRSWKDWIFWDPEGIMFSEMVHFIDLALWFNPSPPVRLFGEGSIRGNFVMIIRHQDRSISALQHSMVGAFDYPKELFEASTNHVTVAMDQHIEVRQAGMPDEPTIRTFPHDLGEATAPREGMAGYMRTLAEETARAVETGEPPRFQNVRKGHYQHLDRFLDHVEGKGENPCDLESAIVVNRLALKFLESTRLGLPIAVGPEDWSIPEAPKAPG